MIEMSAGNNLVFVSEMKKKSQLESNSVYNYLKITGELS